MTVTTFFGITLTLAFIFFLRYFCVGLRLYRDITAFVHSYRADDIIEGLCLVALARGVHFESLLTD